MALEHLEDNGYMVLAAPETDEVKSFVAVMKEK
jgi:hypothetical protein